MSEDLRPKVLHLGPGLGMGTYSTGTSGVPRKLENKTLKCKVNFTTPFYRYWLWLSFDR